jgi:hypothetical protein
MGHLPFFFVSLTDIYYHLQEYHNGYPFYTLFLMFFPPRSVRAEEEKEKPRHEAAAFPFLFILLEGNLTPACPLPGP